MATISLSHYSIDPHCIFGGYTPVCQYNYGSIVYFMAAIPHKSRSPKHRYACLGFWNMSWYWLDVCVQLPSGSPSLNPCLNIYKVLQPSVRIFWLHTLGGILLHIKITQLDKCHICLSLVASVATPLRLVANVASWLQGVVNVVESCYHNDDTKEALETSHVLGLKEETSSLRSNIS